MKNNRSESPPTPSVLSSDGDQGRELVPEGAVSPGHVSNTMNKEEGRASLRTVAAAMLPSCSS